MGNPKKAEKQLAILKLIHERIERIVFLDNSKSAAVKGTLNAEYSQTEFIEKGYEELWSSIQFKGVQKAWITIDTQINEEYQVVENLIKQLKEI